MTEVLHDTFHCQGETDSVLWAKKMTHEQKNRRPPKCLVSKISLKQSRAARRFHQQGARSALQSLSARVVEPEPRTGNWAEFKDKTKIPICVLCKTLC